VPDADIVEGQELVNLPACESLCLTPTSWRARNWSICPPYKSIKAFENFFDELDKNLKALHVNSCRVTETSLKDVFLKVGEDHTVKPETEKPLEGIGSAHSYESNFIGLVIGIAGHKLRCVLNDSSAGGCNNNS
jgi:hypothetical protein